MRFINSVVDSDKDNNIFEQERSFSGVFNTFVNQWYAEKNKNVFKLPFRLHNFSPNAENVRSSRALKIQFSTLPQKQSIANYSILVKLRN